MKKEKQDILIIIIAVLLIIIALLWFFLWKNYNKALNNNDDKITTDNTSVWQLNNIKIKIINDKRCSECDLAKLISDIKSVPALTNVEIEKKDFSDKWVKEYLTKNNIKVLPAMIFNKNQIDSGIDKYLMKISSGEYSLQIWANFNPFVKRSDRWLPILDLEKLKEVKENVFIKWNENASVTWIEYSELECPYCSKLHDDWTDKDLIKKYGEDLNIIFQHFPLEFHENALPWAKILECLWEQKWSESFYALIKESFLEKKSGQDFLIGEAVKLWANKEKLKECSDSDKYEDKITKQQEVWKNIFWITGTPWNIIISNKTWEYIIISWAHPTNIFEGAIDELLWVDE